MRLLLDTSVLIALSKNDKATLSVLAALQSHFPHPPRISFMTYVEFYEGILDKEEKKRQELLRYLQSFPLLIPGQRTASILATLKRERRRKGRSIALADLMIAAQAMDENCAIVTHDAGFKSIEGLNVILV